MSHKRQLVAFYVIFFFDVFSYLPRCNKIRYEYNACVISYLFMSPLLIFQQAGLVQLPSSVNSCSPSDNQASSQTNMTIDMNAVSSLRLADLLQQQPSDDWFSLAGSQFSRRTVFRWC